MRPTNGHSAAPVYRVVSASKRQRMAVNGELPTRPVATKFKTQNIENNFSTANDEYDDDDDDQYSDELQEENDDTEWQPRPNAEPAMRVLKTSQMRPLLELLSEESSAISRPRQRGQTAAATSQKRIYQDISLSSDDDELVTKIEAEEVHLQNEEPVPKTVNVRRFLWTPKSTSVFLDLWEKYLKDIRGKRKNSLIHKQMAEEMSEYGLTHKEIKCKMDNLTKKYKTELEKIKAGNETNWRYFKRVKYLLYGKVDFEEIMFDTNADSSPFFEFDNSEAGSQDLDVCQEDLQLKEEVEQEEENIIEQRKEEPPADVMKMPEKNGNASAAKSDRMLHIELEKLEIEKQKLLVMKHISHNLTSISKTLVELLRNTKK